MRKTILFFAVLFFVNAAFPQIEIGSSSYINKGRKGNYPKKEINYIIYYVQEYEQSIAISYYPVNYPKFKYLIAGFETLDSLVNWLNSPRGYYHTNVALVEPKHVLLDETQIIAIYDLKNAQKIELSLIQEEKKLEKRVEIQEMKWTDKFYKVKNQE